MVSNQSVKKTHQQNRANSFIMAILMIMAPVLVIGTASAATSPSHVTSDQTWTASGNPYLVDDMLVIMPGNTLTVEEGVEIYFTPNGWLDVRGDLNILGTAANPVLMTIDGGNTTSTSLHWGGIQLQTDDFDVNFIMRNTTVSRASSGVGIACCHQGSILIEDSVFSENNVAISGYAGGTKAYIDNVLFSNNQVGVDSADKIITNSTFFQNQYGIINAERIDVSYSLFDENDIAAYGGRGLLYCNVIEDNRIGVQAFFEGWALEYNLIQDNTEVGVIVGQYSGSVPHATYNTFLNNGMGMNGNGISVDHRNNININFEDNYWGSTSTAVIDAAISDFLDNSNLGLVSYSPMLTSTPNVADCDHSNVGYVQPSVVNNSSNGSNTGSTNVCDNSTASTVDGLLEISTDSVQYSAGDIVSSEFEVCWTPKSTSMSLVAWLNNSNGQTIDKQVRSGSNNWGLHEGVNTFSLDPNGGHRLFLAVAAGSTMNTWDYTADSLNTGQYCWEGLLKVYDTNNTLTFMPVDWDHTCFTVANLTQNNNSGNGTVIDTTPRISLWYGKVNQHNENGVWMTDPDGVSGAGTHAQWGAEGYGDRKLEYCQKFWPNTVAISPMPAEQITFYTRGNAQAYDTTKPVWECVQDSVSNGTNATGEEIPCNTTSMILIEDNLLEEINDLDKGHGNDAGDVDEDNLGMDWQLVGTSSEENTTPSPGTIADNITEESGGFAIPDLNEEETMMISGVGFTSAMSLLGLVLRRRLFGDF